MALLADCLDWWLFPLDYWLIELATHLNAMLDLSMSLPDSVQQERHIYVYYLNIKIR